MRILIVAAALTGCLNSASNQCDGIVCPDTQVCVHVIDPGAVVPDDLRCVSPTALDDCSAVADHAPCGKDLAGRCYGGACLPGGCGNGHVDALDGETCDDGARVPGDGCSADCHDETCGNGFVDLIHGEQCDDTRAHGLAGDGCSSTCQLELATWTDVTPLAPTAREGVAMVEDTGRTRIVAFGGLGEHGALADTWEWVGNTKHQWHLLSPPTSPPARSGHAIGYDAARDRVVVFGGQSASGALLADTWEYDGQTWRDVTPASSPPARVGTQLAYDPDRHVLVMFGGRNGTTLTDTWEWNGAAWTQAHPATSPGAFSSAALAWDGTAVLYLGYKATSPSVFAAQTWRWNGAVWSPLSPANAPPARIDTHLARYVTGFVALYGGFDATAVGQRNPLGDLWLWNGTNWANVAATNLPPARGAAGFAYDGAQWVVFGGETASGPTAETWAGLGAWTVQAPIVGPVARSGATAVTDPRTGRTHVFGGSRPDPMPGPQHTGQYAEVWDWDGSTWFPSTIPSPAEPRDGAAMALDLARDRIVMYGGYVNSVPFTGARGDTQELVGNAWTTVAVANPPPARSNMAMVFDRAHGVSVMVGGFLGSGPTNETWTYDGAWTMKDAGSLPARTSPALAYDEVRGRVVLFGGLGAGQQPLADTWEWDGAAWHAIATASAPPARSFARAAYDPVARRVIVYGGTAGATTFGDAWAYDGADWKPIAAAVGDPGAREDHTVFWDPLSRGVVAFAGRRVGGAIADAWALASAPSDPNARESCVLATDDDDADGLAGCADPDCWGRCDPLCAPDRTDCPADRPRCGDGVCQIPLEDPSMCPADCQ